MNKMYEFLKQNHDMKNFDHVKLNVELPDITTESIKGKRFYVTPEGNKYPSITTVLSDRNKEGIIKWRESVGNDVANQVMRQAASRGTAEHTLIENYLNNEELFWLYTIPNGIDKIELKNSNTISHPEIKVKFNRIINN